MQIKSKLYLKNLSAQGLRRAYILLLKQELHGAVTNRLAPLDTHVLGHAYGRMHMDTHYVNMPEVEAGCTCTYVRTRVDTAFSALTALSALDQCTEVFFY